MEPTAIDKVPHLKQDAKINVLIGAGFAQKLQLVLGYVTQGKEEELKDLAAKVEAKGPLTPLEDATVTLITLVNEIYKQAVASDQVIYKTIEESIKLPTQ